MRSYAYLATLLLLDKVCYSMLQYTQLWRNYKGLSDWI